MTPSRPSVSAAFVRALRLRCPKCGQGKVFHGWFRMHERCAHCQFKFSREDGFYLGSIYVNYGLTAFVVAIAYPLLVFYFEFAEKQVLLATTLGVILFPVWFFRYARSLWLSFDQFVDPK